MTLPDHVFLPDSEPGTYPYSADGMPPFRADTPWPDPLVMAGAIGARTTRLHVSTIVYVLPARHPLLVAKAVATAALLCQGRFAFGALVPLAARGVRCVVLHFHSSGALTDEGDRRPARAVAPRRSALTRPRRTASARCAWSPSRRRFRSSSAARRTVAIRRAAVLGDGYVLPSQPLDGVPEQLARVRRALDEAGRDPEGFRIIVPCLGAPAAEITSILDPLATDIVVMPWPHPGKVDTTILQQKLESLDGWVTSSMEAVRMGVSG